ncbi:hypothetical protein WA026_009002 [Henosepilachna vigintioctopunctata]|uniref:poly(ADP-ribose) glycohydrolase n=1 Tax=Henosepilachna vigintioctopunctata TaxID=420089 RepID=A0AAW1UMM6_9CUCU
MSKNYSGTSITEMCRGHDQWGFYIPAISPGKHHSVLYELAPNSSGVPQPHIPRKPKHWDEDHVRMPYSRHNLFPFKENGEPEVLKARWELICKTLEKPIKSVEDLENAINHYNSSLSRFPLLTTLFEEVLDEVETTEFFDNLLPKIIKLALRLPEILPGSLPLLKKSISKSVSLSQLQISSLLANAFLCTFPWRKEVAMLYPGVNFIRLFSAHGQPSRTNCVVEKLKCIIHYFRRITAAEPKGVVTFERIYLPKRNISRWDVLQNNLGNTRVHIASNGTIEDDGLGFLQVDFANKNIGGGVMSYGCVQEEIRFVICPELLISRLFVEQLGDTEAVIIRGIERFSRYTGYGESFRWDGNFIDETPLDNFGRRQTALTVIDATPFFNSYQQYYPAAVLRELCKAYVGFYSPVIDNLAPVATGNWGCGAFGGDAKLKILIQLMACNSTQRDLVYYTFGDEELQETFYNMYMFIATNQITTSELWRTFCKFVAAKLPADQLYSFIQQSCFDSRNKPITYKNNTSPKKENPSSDKTSTSPKKLKSPTRKDNINTATTSKVAENPGSSDTSNISQVVSSSGSTSSIEDIVPSSQPKNECRIPFVKSKEKRCFDKKLFEENHNEILDIFGEINESPIINKSINIEDNETLLSVCEKFEKIEEQVGKSHTVIDVDDNSMDVDVHYEEPAPKLAKPKKKISDYFSKLGKS